MTISLLQYNESLSEEMKTLLYGSREDRRKRVRRKSAIRNLINKRASRAKGTLAKKKKK